MNFAVHNHSFIDLNMTLKTRRFLFYILLFWFIIIGLAVVSYSRGWRLNANGCSLQSLIRTGIFELSRCDQGICGGILFGCVKFQKTGAIFIGVEQRGATIKIDDKTFLDKSGLMQSGTLITNLSPKNYKVRVEKNGYFPWEKNFLVESGLVTETPIVILVPESLEKKEVPISKPVDNFWLNHQPKIIFRTKQNLYYFQESPPSIVKLRGDEFIQWSNDNKIIVRDSQGQTFYLYDINNLSKTINITAALNNLQKINISRIAFHPFEASRLIIEDKNRFLYVLDIYRLKLEILVKEPVLVWMIKNPNIYFVKEVEDKKTGIVRRQLISFSLAAKTENFSADLPAQLIDQRFSKIDVSGGKIVFMTEKDNLYFFDQANRNFNQITHSAEKFFFSPDNKKIVFSDKDGKINIYFLEDFFRGIVKKSGEVIELNFYNGLDIKNIFWHKNSSHLFIEYSGSNFRESASLDFVEIDDRRPVNKYLLIEQILNSYYVPETNRVYFLKEKMLYYFNLK